MKFINNTDRLIDITVNGATETLIPNGSCDIEAKASENLVTLALSTFKDIRVQRDAEAERKFPRRNKLYFRYFRYYPVISRYSALPDGEYVINEMTYENLPFYGFQIYICIYPVIEGVKASDYGFSTEEAARSFKTRQGLHTATFAPFAVIFSAAFMFSLFNIANDGGILLSAFLFAVAAGSVFVFGAALKYLLTFRSKKKN